MRLAPQSNGRDSHYQSPQDIIDRRHPTAEDGEDQERKTCPTKDIPDITPRLSHIDFPSTPSPGSRTTGLFARIANVVKDCNQRA